MLLYRPISSRDDYTYLQADINAVSEWVDANLLQFNVKKCKVMKISRKKQGVSGSTPDLKLHNQTLEHVDAYKYLGLLISHDLSWSEHIRTYGPYAIKPRSCLDSFIIGSTSMQTQTPCYKCIYH